MIWNEMETAPTNGSEFIGLMKDGLVFLTHRQAYHTYVTKAEAAKTGNCFHPTKMRYGWSYEDADSHMPCKPVGWIPKPDSKDKTLKKDTEAEKPPLGLMPKNLHEEVRFYDICAAISRYYNVEWKIPIEWVKEYNELIDVGANKNKHMEE